MDVLEYIVDTSKPMQLNWGSKGVERILQNIQTLLHTWRYEVAYNRTMGIEPGLLDKPLDIAIAQYTAQVFQLVTDFEPRAVVKEVQYMGADQEGNMQFRVVITIE